MRYYNQGCGDVIRFDLLAVSGLRRLYSKQGIRSVGIQYPECVLKGFSGEDARLFMERMEIVMVLGG
jgi:hypothetical protein